MGKQTTDDKITSDDKPEWFDLDNYSAVTNLTVFEWWMLLHARKNLIDGLKRHPDHRSKDLAEMIENHVKNPLEDLPREYYAGGKEHLRNRLGDTFDLYQASIRPITISRLHSLSKFFPSGYIEHLEKGTSYSDHREYFHKLVDDVLAKPECLATPGMPDGSPVKYLTVDLNAPDELIIRDFKKYLVAARERSRLFEGASMPKGSNSIPEVVRKLRDYKILPYLDLLIWFTHSRQHVYQHVYGDWLFRNEGINSAKKMSDDTCPLSKKALTEEFLASLFNLQWLTKPDQ